MFHLINSARKSIPRIGSKLMQAFRRMLKGALEVMKPEQCGTQIKQIPAERISAQYEDSDPDFTSTYIVEFLRKVSDILKYSHTLLFLKKHLKAGSTDKDNVFKYTKQTKEPEQIWQTKWAATPS